MPGFIRIAHLGLDDEELVIRRVAAVLLYLADDALASSR
jgi:hypothetical protein